MTTDKLVDALLQENDRLRTQAENEAVSAMFESFVKASEPFDTFCTWLLVATSATGTFMVANADKILPYLNTSGFLACGATLVISSIFGITAKMYGMVGRIAIATELDGMAKGEELLKKYATARKQLTDAAEKLGVAIDTSLRPDRMLAEFCKPMPGSMLKSMREEMGPLGIYHSIAARKVVWQMRWGRLQSIAFIFFLITGFGAAALAQTS